MKKTYLLVFVLISVISNVFSQDYLWTVHSSDPQGVNNFPKTVNGADMVIVSSDNIYITGNFRGTIDFDFGIEEYKLTSNNYDVYICKYDTNGDFIWAKSIGDSSFESATSIVADQNENIYVSGSFEGSLDFNPDPSADFILTAPTDRSANFILKLDADGEFVWAKSFGKQTSPAQIATLAIDADSNLICVGAFRETADFNPSDTEIFNLTSNGNEDVYILKLDANGNFIWAKSLTGSINNEYATAIAVDNDNNLIIGGEFYLTVDFNPSSMTTNNHTAAGIRDYFLLKLDTSGNYIWSKTAGGIASEQIEDIAIDNNNKIYVSGYIEDNSDVDPSTNVFELQVQGLYNAFMAKFEPNGDFVWASNIDGVDVENRPGSISIDAENNVYFSGIFNQTADLDPTTGTDERTAIGDDNYYVLKLDENLAYQWAQPYGLTDSNTYTTDLEINNAGELVVFQEIDAGTTNILDLDFTANTDNQYIDSRKNIALAKWTTASCVSKPIATVNDPILMLGTTSAELLFTTDSPNLLEYVIDYNSSAELAGFVDIAIATPIAGANFTIPAGVNTGTYSGTITYFDGNGCSGSDDFTITIIEPLSINTLILSKISCSGNNDGSLQIMVTGGIAPYQYELRDSADNLILPPQTSNIFEGLTAGSYVVRVQDSKGSEIFGNLISLVEPPLLFVQAITTAITCKGANNGSITVETSGGMPPYSYRINGGGYGSSNVFSKLTPGFYIVEVTDTNGCVVSKNVSLVEPDEAFEIASIITTNVTCQGVQDGSIEVILSGGIPPYQYQINNGALTTANTFADLGSGVYVLTVFDASNCEQTATIAIEEPESLAFFQISKESTSCPFDTNGSIVIEVVGGTSPYQYSIDNSNFVPEHAFNNLQAGAYTVVVKDANGCEISEQVIIDNQAGPDFDNDGIIDVCDDDIDNDGVIDTEDLCPDTPPGTLVGSNGCKVFSLPVTNFSIQTVGESCTTSNNGSITVVAVETFEYEASLSFDGVVIRTQPFTEEVAFTNLESGIYELCITIPEQPSYLNCFSLSITEPEPLAVRTTVNKTNMSIILNMRGGKVYEITLNGTVHTTTATQINLPLASSLNTLSIKTDKACQGIHEETFLLGSEATIYPNPVSKEEELTILFSGDASHNIHLTLYTTNGREVRQRSYDAGKTQLKFNVSGLYTGMYFLQISNGKALQTRKIIVR
ncbi:MAG: T9SS type A sorting domain-containing protein [Bacteroidota bacterium]